MFLGFCSADYILTKAVRNILRKKKINGIDYTIIDIQILLLKVIHT